MHPDAHIREELSLGVEAEGLTPENLDKNVPARHRGTGATLLFDNLSPESMRKVRVFNFVGALLFGALAVWVLYMLGVNGQLDAGKWVAAINADAWVHFYLPGVINTLVVALISVLGAVVFGMVFGIFRVLPSWTSKIAGGAVVEFSRAVPVLLFMIFFWRMFAFLGLGDASAFWAVFVSLVLYNGSIVAELVRSGVGNLPKGQREAAFMLGMTPTQALRIVELPQALKAMLPAMATQLVVVIKDTALGYIIVFMELLHEARRLGSGNDNMLQTLTVTALIYFAICFVMTKITEKVFG